MINPLHSASENIYTAFRKKYAIGTFTSIGELSPAGHALTLLEDIHARSNRNVLKQIVYTLRNVGDVPINSVTDINI